MFATTKEGLIGEAMFSQCCMFFSMCLFVCGNREKSSLCQPLTLHQLSQKLHTQSPVLNGYVPRLSTNHTHSPLNIIGNRKMLDVYLVTLGFQPPLVSLPFCQTTMFKGS